MSLGFDMAPPPGQDQFGMSPSGVDPESPGLFKGTAAAIPEGIMRGSVNLGIGAALAASNVATLTDAASGYTHYGDWYFNHVVDPLIDSRERLDKLSANNGVAANTLGAVTGGVLQAGFGGPAALGLSEGVSGAAVESKRSGLGTAYEIGGVEGLFSYATARLPLRLPFAAGATAKTFKNAVYGGLVGAGSAVAEPAAEKFVYTVNGQPEDAKRINVWDARNIVANAALGIFFSTLGKHPASPLVDAALHQNDIEGKGKTAQGAADPAAGANAVLNMDRDVAAGKPAVDAAQEHGAPLSDEAIAELRQSATETVSGLPKDAPKPTDPMGAAEPQEAAGEAVEAPKATAPVEGEEGKEGPAKQPEAGPGQRVIDVPGFGKVTLDQNHDIPWAGGSSNDGSRVYAQKGMNLIEHINGKDYDFGIPLGIHELVERKLEKQGQPYLEAHHQAEVAEDKWVHENWPEAAGEYEARWKPKIKMAEDRARAGDVSVPKDLVEKPYGHPDNPLERKMHDEVFGAEREKGAQPEPPKPPKWAPMTEDGIPDQTPYEKVQQLADQLDNQGAVDPETGRKAGDILREAMDMMRASKQAQSVIDEAAACIVGAFNG